MRLFVLVAWALTGLNALSGADSAFDPSPEATPDGVPASEIIQRYSEAVEAQQERNRDVTMDISIDAKLPKLKKQGTFHALRHVSRLGQISYNGARFVGDKIVKNDVIARYLAAETEAVNGHANNNGALKPASISISPANYKFKYRGEVDFDGRSVYVFQVSPKKKRVGLFKGEVWVDAGTYLPLRESGRFVKSPSLFLKKIEFARVYEIREGVALPRRIISRIETRVVGNAELHVEFSNYALGDKSLQAMVCPMGW